ncbi:hypothetical protein BH23CHL7_BH23CHL7_20810 [soil metagenome]
MSAYAYLRKSSVRDPARDTSPETQEREVRALAKRHGDNGSTLVILADWDISGRGQYTKKRLAYQQLIAAIEAGACSAVYSYSLSRLGRSVTELSRLFDLCHEHGVPVRLVVDAVDTSTASGRLLANVLGSVAQFEADVTSERMRAMFATKRARGEPVGTAKFYGDGEGEDVAAVLAAYSEAGSHSGAARLLNERGIKPRNSKRGWWPSSVAVVIQRLNGQQDGPHATKAVGPDFLLAKVLRCPTCGTMLTGLRDRHDGPNGGRTRYACRLGSVRPHERVSITEHLILPAIRAEADRLVTPEQLVSEGDTAQRADLEQRKARVLDMFEAGHVDRDERERRLAAINEQVARLDAHRTIAAIPRLDWTWPPKQINAVLRAMFEAIELDPATFQPVRFEWMVPEWRAP